MRKPKLLPEMPCIVENWRKKPAEWEPGRVTHVESHWQSDGSHYNIYSVILDRKIKKEGIRGPYESHIKIYARESEIKPL